MNGTYACWRCSPPRYVFDWRFAVSFFVFLWNNALNIAIGQCLIAGAVGVWFFTGNSEKGKRRVIAQSTWHLDRLRYRCIDVGWSPAEECLQVSFGLIGIWLLHHCGDPVHQVSHEVLRAPCP